MIGVIGSLAPTVASDRAPPQFLAELGDGRIQEDKERLDIRLRHAEQFCKICREVP